MYIKSIEIWSSVIGYIAKCVALVRKEDTDAGCRACDIALGLYPNHVSLFLIKVCFYAVRLGAPLTCARVRPLLVRLESMNLQYHA